ncbi:hypothetical protein BH10PSE19_BH10PSE19_14100 [soil metagenome]
MVRQTGTLHISYCERPRLFGSKQPAAAAGGFFAAQIPNLAARVVAEGILPVAASLGVMRRFGMM